MSLFTGGSALGALLTGPLSDRVGHRRMMVLCALGYGGFLLAYAGIKTPWGLILLGLPHGMVWSGLLTGTMSMVGTVLSPERRADGLSLFGLASPGGVVFGPSVGLFLFQHSGFGTITVLLAAIFMVLGLLATGLPEPPPRSEVHRFGWPPMAVVEPCLVLFGTALGYGTLSTYTAQESLELHLRFPGAFLTTLAVGMVLMRLAMARWGHAFHLSSRPMHLLPWMLGGSALGLALLAALPGGLFRHLASALLYGACYSMVHTLVNTRILDVVPPDRRGSAFGTLLFAFDAGIGLGNFLIGGLIGIAFHKMGVAGFRVGWAVGALAAATMIPLTLHMRRSESAALKQKEGASEEAPSLAI